MFCAEPLNPLPSAVAVHQLGRTADDGDLAMAEVIEVLDGEIAALLVVHDDRPNRILREIAADDDGGQFAVAQLREPSAFLKEPVGDDDQTFDAAIHQQVEIAGQLFGVVVRVHHDGLIAGGAERFLNAAQDEGAEGIGEIEDHDADGVAAAAAQRARKEVGAVAHSFRGFADALFGSGGDVAREGRVIEHDGNGGWREAALSGDIDERDMPGSGRALGHRANYPGSAHIVQTPVQGPGRTMRNAYPSVSVGLVFAQTVAPRAAGSRLPGRGHCLPPAYAKQIRDEAYTRISHGLKRGPRPVQAEGE